MTGKNFNGLVMCGGNSSRMGMDKSKIRYHQAEQRYHVFDLLKEFCKEVFISCNPEQAREIKGNYPFVSDAPIFSNTGPVGGLLTAFTMHPGKDFLVIGCDYPLLTKSDLKKFLKAIPVATKASAFYNLSDGFYEPLLAFYTAKCRLVLETMHKENNHSLQQFLKSENAFRFTDYDTSRIRSIDTVKEMQTVQELLKTEE